MDRKNRPKKTVKTHSGPVDLFRQCVKYEGELNTSAGIVTRQSDGRQRR